jgi:hypothetical protein
MSSNKISATLTDGPHDSDGFPDVRPRWRRDLIRFLPLKSQFVLSGNVRDLQVHEFEPGKFAPVPPQSALASELYAAGFAHLLSVDCIRGPKLLTRTGIQKPADELLTKWQIPENSAIHASR